MEKLSKDKFEYIVAGTGQQATKGRAEDRGASLLSSPLFALTILKQRKLAINKSAEDGARGPNIRASSALNHSALRVGHKALRHTRRLDLAHIIARWWRRPLLLLHHPLRFCSFLFLLLDSTSAPCSCSFSWIIGLSSAPSERAYSRGRALFIGPHLLFLSHGQRNSKPRWLTRQWI